MDADKLALVLSFGRLSVLEGCAVLRHKVVGAEAPTERIAVFSLRGSASDSIQDLAGIHKCAPFTLVENGEPPDLKDSIDEVTQYLEEKSNFSLSSYGLTDDDHDRLVRSLLDGFRSNQLKKIRLLRPRDRELQSDEILARRALDMICFPYHGRIGLGPTVWVPDAASMRRRGTARPSPHPDISLSPRLAKVLLNLAGLTPGQTVLDPFCGSGTILVEAQVRSLRCLGLDSSASRVQETRKNLQWLGVRARDAGYDIRKGEAKNLGLFLRGTKVDAVVTEPVLLPRLNARPKTTTAREMIAKAGEIYSQALAAMANALRPEGRIVVVVPTILTMDGEEVTLTLEGRRLGLRAYQPGPTGFEYPVRLSFESTRWVRRAVYVFESVS